MRAVKCEKCGKWITASDVNCRHCHHSWLDDLHINPIERKLVSVDEHNSRIKDEKYAHMTDIACPECGEQLKWTRGQALMSNPPQYPVKCDGCGWTGHVL